MNQQFDFNKASYKELYIEAKRLQIPQRSYARKEGLKEMLKHFQIKEPIKLPSLGELLNDQIKKLDDRVGVASYAHKFTDGTTNFQVSDICHARIFGGYHNKNKTIVECVLHVNGHYERSLYKEDYKEFLDFMMNRSPWASCFKTKSVNDALKEGVYVNVEELKDRVACAAIALRQASEFQDKLFSWSNYRNLAASERVAWFLACVSSLSKEKVVKLRGLGGGHDVLCRDRSLKDVLKFFKEGWHKEVSTIKFKDSPGKDYNIFFSIASKRNSKEEPISINKFLKEIIKEKIVGDGWNVVIKNADDSARNLIDAVSPLID